MGCGTPVVASRVHGIPEIVTHEYNGLLVDPHDVESISAEIKRGLTDDALKSKLIRNGQDFSKEYSWDKIGEGIFGLYEKILAQSPSS
jgi:glycosyltransferase involved in cell wall biosynthesis